MLGNSTRASIALRHDIRVTARPHGHRVALP
jgi:hypothetical protein